VSQIPDGTGPSMADQLAELKSALVQTKRALTDVYADAVAMAKHIRRQKETEMDHHTVVLYVDQAGEWRWHREAANGSVVSDSGEGYVNYQDCREMAEKVNSEATFIVLQEKPQ
jgi:uncharacterized protein YegP (UPF0339 family)